MCSWDTLHDKRCPNGASLTARLERVSAAEFAALIGRPGDTALRSVAKTGAWHTLNLQLDKLLPANPFIRGSGGPYNSNSQLGVDPSSVTLKYAPSTDTLSLTAYVAHADSFF